MCEVAEKSLAVAFEDSLNDEAMNCLSELAEVGLDSIMEDGLLKDVPILSTIISGYKIGKTIHERQNIKKLISFICKINKGIDGDKRNAYIEKFNVKQKSRNQQLEYILILIDRYIDYKKPEMLAKLYLAHLDERISWNEFTIYAEAIDNFLPGDEKLLCIKEAVAINSKMGNSGYARLTSLGLMAKYTEIVGLDEIREDVSELKDVSYELTKDGKKLSEILRGENG